MLKQTKSQLKSRARLGQHFLIDRRILASIADAADVKPTDTVVEIGPGKGSLTRILAERAGQVIAVELDGDLVDLLKTDIPSNVIVRQADARNVAISTLVEPGKPYKLVGNLPYYAAMPILRHFLENSFRPMAVAILVQSEVAREMCAIPGSMSLISLAVQLYGSPKLVRRVRPGSFNPAPQVDSAVVGIKVFNQLAHGVIDPVAFFHVARAGFSAPRKQLRNALSIGLAMAPSKAEELLRGASIDPHRRAESLGVDEWASLCRHLQASAG